MVSIKIPNSSFTLRINQLFSNNFDMDRETEEALEKAKLTRNTLIASVYSENEGESYWEPLLKKDGKFILDKNYHSSTFPEEKSLSTIPGELRSTVEKYLKLIAFH